MSGPDRTGGPTADLVEFVARLPKTETHLHLEGALPLPLLRRVAPDRFADGPPPWWEPAFRYAEFAAFETALLGNAVLWFTSVERYHEAAAWVFRDLVRQKVRYVETSFHLPVSRLIGADPREILDAIRAAAPPGLTVRVFAGMTRRDHAGELAPVIDALAGWEHLAGVDLHGDETWALEPWTATTWRRVAEAGKVIKAHAGELAGAQSVRQVVEQLGVRRVQHGIRAIEDPAVVELLRARDATCDVCVTSNVKLRVVPSYAEHPLPRLLAAGIRCTVSTDDPFSFGVTLSDEYLALATQAGLSRADLVRVARNGFEVAELPAENKARALAELDVLAAASTA